MIMILRSAPSSKPAIFFNERFARLLDTRTRVLQKNISTCFLVCKGLPNDDVGWHGAPVLQEIQPGAGFKTGDFDKEKLGGAGALP